MKYILQLFNCFAVTLLVCNCSPAEPEGEMNVRIGRGSLPALAISKSGDAYVVYGSGDSLLYSISDNRGGSFTPPQLIAVVPGLWAAHMRGPQVAVSASGAVVIACNKSGDIFSFKEKKPGEWMASKKVNDIDTVAKEAFLAVAAEGEIVYAVWLDLRDKANKIMGARSSDGGVTWSANQLIYASPDTTVCECCKPSVEIKGNKLAVMFRNWIGGNRDLYLISSADTGKIFGQAIKLGKGSWALNGCPMDGGGMYIDKNGRVETAWGRENTLYSCIEGGTETPLGEGRHIVLTGFDNKRIYVWSGNGNISCVQSDSTKIILGKGTLPVLKSFDKNTALCVWENDQQIEASVIRYRNN